MSSKTKLKRKTRNERDDDNDLIDDRKTKVKRSNVSSNHNEMFIGAHVSIAGGIKSSVIEADSIGAKAFAMFLCNQRQWKTKVLSESDAQEFRDATVKYGFPSHLIVPHGSYLLNCGAPNDETLEKSRNLLLDGLKRCEMLGIDIYNFHPGSSCGKISVDDCVNRIAQSIDYAHSLTNNVVTVLENMSKQGNTIGGDFNELKAIIDRVKDKSRVGICLDTCHAFAAGYDLSKSIGYDKMMNDFETIIGFKYLKAIHLNDSKGKVNSHTDRHENIGKGFIGIDGFKRIMNEPRFKNIPIVLETPYTDGIYEKEIKLLYNLID